MPIDLAEIRAFLNRPGIEGPQVLRGYIPCKRLSDGRGRNYIGPEGTAPLGVEYPAAGDPGGYAAMGVSGVTIATGVDLGQTDAQALVRGGLEPGIANTLRPYFGLRQNAALHKLHALPLAVSPDAACALDNATLGVHAGLIGRRYDSDRPATAFAELPRQAQAAIFSLLYQRGTGVAGKAPNTWAALVAGDWRGAAALLCDASLWDGYQLRRRMEGALLKEIA